MHLKQRSWAAGARSSRKELVGLSQLSLSRNSTPSKFGEEIYEVQTATVVTVTTATGATPAEGATTEKVRAASPTCCLLSANEVEVEEEEEV